MSALMYKAVEKMEPFEIWGNGQQERDFTYVTDIVDGSILASEKISDCTPINLGTGKRYSILRVVEIICDILKWKPQKFIFDKSKPTGALSRALDNKLAKELLGWEPKVTLEQGIRHTIDWYLDIHKRSGNVNLEKLIEHT